MEWLLPLRKPVLDRGKPLRSEYQKLLVFYFSEVSKAKRTFLKTPEDPEAAHQFRIKIRQMRSLISFIKPLMDQEKYQLIQSRLRRLTNRFSNLRELDAIMEEWLLLTEKHADYPDVSTAFGEVIEKERLRQVTELLKLYRADQSFIGLEDIWVLIIEASWELDEKMNGLYGEYIDSRINKLLKKAESDFKSIDFIDKEKTHKLRIGIKKLRYDMAILEPKIKRKTQIMNNLKMLQYKLGLICDAHRDELILSELRTRYDEKTFHYESGLLSGYLIAKSDRIEEELENFHRI
jgi:CHAD domain-containing protein